MKPKRPHPKVERLPSPLARNARVYRCLLVGLQRAIKLAAQLILLYIVINLPRKDILGFRHNTFCMYKAMDAAWDIDDDDTNIGKGFEHDSIEITSSSQYSLGLQLISGL